MEVPSNLGSRFLLGNLFDPTIRNMKNKFGVKCKWDDATFAYSLQSYFVPTGRNKSKIFGHMTAYSQSTKINWL